MFNNVNKSLVLQHKFKNIKIDKNNLMEYLVKTVKNY